MKMELENYVLVLLIISFSFFYFIGSWLNVSEAEMYINLLLTIAVVHFVMSKLITIKKKEEKTK